jgi:hypothetical protein
MQLLCHKDLLDVWKQSGNNHEGYTEDGKNFILRRYGIFFLKVE